MLSGDFFAHVTPPKPSSRWVIGFSGGLDSSVLLQLCAAYRDKFNPAQALIAIHVNHGLADEANEWQRHCEQLCERWRVPLLCRKVTITKGNRQSLEQIARQQRYQVFQELCCEADLLLLAHHQDDQIETLLYRLARGTGILGMRGMDGYRQTTHYGLWRPLLAVSRDELLHYGKQQDLDWIDDPSNQDTRYDRNFIRHQLLPLMESRWPGVRATLARGARHAAEAALLNDALAHQDLAARAEGNELLIEKLNQLPNIRCKNLLRYWLRQHGATPPGEKVLQEILTAIGQYHPEQDTAINWSGAASLNEADRWQIRTFQGKVWLLAEPPAIDSDWQGRLIPGRHLTLPGGLGSLLWAESGSEESDTESLQLAASRLPATLTVKFRGGGEYFQPPGRPNKSLKKWFHEWRVPPWERGRIPLLYADDQLIGVFGYGVAEGWQPTPGGKNKPAEDSAGKLSGKTIIRWLH